MKVLKGVQMPMEGVNMKAAFTLNLSRGLNKSVNLCFASRVV